MYLNTSTKQPLIVTLFLRHIHLWLSLQSKMKNLPLAHVTVTQLLFREGIISFRTFVWSSFVISNR